MIKTEREVEEFLQQFRPETVEDTKSFGEMWVFGQDYDSTELYIKISLGKPGTNTVCISFHLAEHPLVYRYKK